MKYIIAIMILIAIMAVSYWLLFLGRNSSNDNEQPVGNMVTITGKSTCLPHQDTDGPITLECALGLETPDGSYYALDMSGLPSDHIDYSTAETITISGKVIMRDELPETDPRLKYAITGVIAVETVTEGPEITAPATHTIRGGEVSFAVTDHFGLATTKEQILVQSVIPPCDEDFDYCLYYNNDTYTGSNFDSAGLRIKKRDDLIGENCLTTSPEGYNNLAPDIKRSSDHATSRFSDLQDAGAGHYASGSLYRLATEIACYEFETRIGQSQYENYPEGSVRRFTETDQLNVKEDLNELLSNIRMTGKGSEIIFDL